jgi:lipopolysaccharide/colanic/teichoic acid biosynthesis glycosyltransferase
MRFARVSPPSVPILIVCDTLILLGCYILAAKWTQISDLDTYLLYSDGLLKISIVVVSFQLGMYVERLYERLVPSYQLLQPICLLLGAVFLLQAFLEYGDWNLQLEKWVMIYGSILVLPLFTAWRLAFSALIKAVPLARILFLGASPEIDEVARHLNGQPSMGLSILGYLDAGPLLLTAAPKLGSMKDFDSVVHNLAPQRIIIGTKAGQLPVRQLLELQLMGMRVEEFDPFYASILGRISAINLRPSELIFSSELDPKPFQQFVQSIYSAGLAALLILLTSPVLAIGAILVKASSSGPVLIKERRSGKGGAPLDLLLFRTRETPSGRRTATGDWLERLRIAKLPLLINLLRGEILLVGPKPERPEFATLLERRIPFYRHRHCVKPGLMGWAQIHTLDHTFEDAVLKLEYEFYYIRNLAISLDVHILLRTLFSR